MFIAATTTWRSRSFCGVHASPGRETLLPDHTLPQENLLHSRRFCDQRLAPQDGPRQDPGQGILSTFWYEEVRTDEEQLRLRPLALRCFRLAAGGCSAPDFHDVAPPFRVGRTKVRGLGCHSGQQAMALELARRIDRPPPRAAVPPRNPPLE